MREQKGRQRFDTMIAAFLLGGMLLSASCGNAGTVSMEDSGMEDFGMEDSGMAESDDSHTESVREPSRIASLEPIQKKEETEADALPQETTETSEESGRFHNAAWPIWGEISDLPPEQQKVVDQLFEYDIFEDGVMELTGLIVEDMDENGQYDCVVMLRDTRNTEPFNPYGYGCVYIYYNGQEPYRFYDEDMPYLGEFHVCWADLTGDGRLEIVIESMGTGVGAIGDWHMAVVSDTGEGMKILDFPDVPEEMAEDGYPGVRIDVYMEAEEDTYSAYCPYMEESITFQSPWTDLGRSYELTEPRLVGRNIRGYVESGFDEADGRNRLIVFEYLCGEGGVWQCVGCADFAIVWEEDGTSRIEEWWIEVYD